MRTVNIHEAKTHLSRLIEAVEGGEEVVIARGGRPAVRLARLHAPTARRQLGALAGRLQVPPDFDAALPDDVVAAFEGRAA